MHRGDGFHEERKVTVYGEAQWFPASLTGNIIFISRERSPFMGRERTAGGNIGRNTPKVTFYGEMVGRFPVPLGIPHAIR
jgi:hypothetical protein